MDLGPENFLLRARTEAAVIIDLGTCEPHEGGERVFRARIGSPQFMSPEMRAHRRADVRSDVYSFGLLLFFLSTGRLPSAEWDTAELRRQAGEAPSSHIIPAPCAEDPAALPPTARGVLDRLG